MIPVFGRTNRAVPKVWLKLVAPSPADPEAIEPLINAAIEANTILDISSQAALWGGFVRSSNVPLMTIGRHDVERAVSSDQAANFVQAHLIEVLSAIGRDHIDFYYMPYRRALEEFQIDGILEALENAKSDGVIRHLGLAPNGPPMAALGLWQFHDAFETVLLRPGEDYDMLAPMAQERRVGIVSAGPVASPIADHPVLHTVSRADQI